MVGYLAEGIREPVEDITSRLNFKHAESSSYAPVISVQEMEAYTPTDKPDDVVGEPILLTTRVDYSAQDEYRVTPLDSLEEIAQYDNAA